jgi:hypothetical protein
MQIGLSFLSSSRSLLGIEVRKGMEPVGLDNKLHFQPTVITTIGLIFFYIDIIFNLGKPITMSEAMPDLEHLGEFDETDFDDK